MNLITLSKDHSLYTKTKMTSTFMIHVYNRGSKIKMQHKLDDTVIFNKIFLDKFLK